MLNLNKTVVFILIVLSISSAFGQSTNSSQGTSKGQFTKVGAAGAQFLKIGIGARATGMGGAFGAISDDLSAYHWNPAGLMLINGYQGMFNYTQWFGGYNHSFGAGTMPLGDDYRVTVSMTSFSSDFIEITTIQDPTGTGSFYTVSDVAVAATFSGRLSDKFTFGATAKIVSNNMSSLNATGMLFDIGTLYSTGIEGLKLAFSIHNFGDRQQYSGQDLNKVIDATPGLKVAQSDLALLSSPFAVPMSFRIGLSTDYFSKLISSDYSSLTPSPEHKLLADFDFETLSDTPEQFALGLEYTYNSLVSLRGGYRFGHNNLGVAGGVGLKYEGTGFKGSFDYSINPTSNMGIINRVGVTLNFD